MFKFQVLLNLIGGNLQIWEGVSEPQQQYKISYIDGFYKITNINSGKV